MADVIDDAQAAESLVLAEAMARRQRMIETDHEGPMWVSGTPLCRECGDAIPLDRIMAVQGCSRCIRCQSIHEEGTE
ncbi:TraR/DksA family transcriptional regulator [Desulfovibrio sp. X2]|uniref:TraR/DksA C4-type zinc finger protein n=1 Tax=Desulfovibrio sp. X2 TaxID=941449 RepID=UPI000358B554|nr:TraR/DksA C4-type zinc finger protein [Desulfovibrio sp. X2]EPR42712.1 TraR/DksA family transcriptional regulator [Desulfovibrio sp. X2]